MNVLKQAINDNCHLLAELNNLLNQLMELNPELYSSQNSVLSTTSIGSHVRHIIEHYHIFLQALTTQSIVNYDRRSRDKLCEKCLLEARQQIASVIHKLEKVSGEDQPLRVSIITNPSMRQLIASSSVLREIQFLQSHTVHHLALIGLVLKEEGLMLEGCMVKAPSTLQYEQES